MKRLIVILGVLFAVTLTIMPAAGQDALGTRSANVPMAVQPATSLSWILPSLSYYNASAASGGIGLRNQRNGTITISGVTTPSRLLMCIGQSLHPPLPFRLLSKV